jgi:hypothetical protein
MYIAKNLDGRKLPESIGFGIGGRSGIRTHEGLAPLPDFKSGAFNRSATRPGESTIRKANPRDGSDFAWTRP